MNTTIRRASRVALALVAGAGLALVPALSASAHVTVSSIDAAPGGFGKVTLRGPSESDTANTTSLTVQLPTDTPFAFVTVEAVPGWTAETTTEPLAEPVEVEGFTVTEAVTSVTWTADGEGLAPHEFSEFAISAGPFPDVDELSFPATQTYSDGEVVEWNEPTPESGEEPERPAPVLALGATSTDDGSDGSTDTVARVLGAIGLGLGVIAIVIAVAGTRSRRRAA
jgi:uncharacterized protein YcnI